jgi:hypothetical protein
MEMFRVSAHALTARMSSLRCCVKASADIFSLDPTHFLQNARVFALMIPPGGRPSEHLLKSRSDPIVFPIMSVMPLVGSTARVVGLFKSKSGFVMER